MATSVLSKVLPKVTLNRQKYNHELSEEEVNFLTSNTTLEKEKVEAQHRNFLSNHKSGQISKKKFDSMIKESYPGTKASKLSRHLFRMYDTNGDGSVDFKEYVLGLDILTNGTPEQNLKQIFRLLDINNDGKINMKELKKILKDIKELSKENNSGDNETDEKLAIEAFSEMDLNEDGDITEEEFIAACLAQKKFSTIVTLQIIKIILE